MHGIICRSFEGFLNAAYGQPLWLSVREQLDLSFESFEPMFHYGDDILSDVVDACSAVLGKPREALLEDFGTYLVAGMTSGRVRRLLRYGGLDYEDFLHSFEELPGRAALAVPDIRLPDIELLEPKQGEFELICRSDFDGAGFVVTGLLRALADDYGALVLISHEGSWVGGEIVSINLLEKKFAEGRGFHLDGKSDLSVGERA